MADTEQENDDSDSWSERVTASLKTCQPWYGRCEKIKRIYQDNKTDGNTGQHTKRMNILWSNVQTIAPVLYSRMPVPVVQVKNPPPAPPSMPGQPTPPDPLQKVSEILKKALETQIREYDFDGAIKQTGLEYLLTARGAGWIAYEPSFRKIETGEVDESGEPVTQEIKDGENVFYIFINHKDFITSKARVWEEVIWVGRGLDLTRGECKKNFPDLYAQGKIVIGDSKKLRVWEIWDKDSGEQIFVCPDNVTKILKRGPAPIKFDNFFPCPKPIYSNLDNESLIPTPDYAQYQDQAGDLNKYTERLSRLGDAMKVRGVYQAVNGDLQRLFDDNMENTMVPTNTPMDKGNTPFQFIPLDIFAQAAVQLAALKQAAKQDIYEITGISDIVRGQSDPNETATAQNIKNQWGGLRIKEKQKDLQRYIRDIFRLKSEVIAELFSPETIQAMSGVQITPDLEQILRNGDLRKFVIDVETDSTIEPDAQQEKQDRTDFLQALSQYLNTAMELGQAAPALAPMLTQLVMFGVKAFPIGNELEQTIKQSLDAATEQQANAPPKPDPEQEKAQAASQQAQAQMQMDQAKMKSDSQVKQQEMQASSQAKQDDLSHAMQVEQMKIEADLVKQQRELAFQREIEQLKMETEIRIEQMRLRAQSGMKPTVKDEEEQFLEDQSKAEEVTKADIKDQKITAILEGISGTLEKLSAPKTVSVVRDESGRISGALSQ